MKKSVELFKFPDPEPGKSYNRNNKKLYKNLEKIKPVKRRINITHENESKGNMDPPQDNPNLCFIHPFDYFMTGLSSVPSNGQ